MATIQSLPAPSYITVDLVVSGSTFSAFDDLSVEDITILIQNAEETIDAYVGRQKHHPNDDNRHRVFPRAEDVDINSVVIIPLQVTQATLRQVEWLYTEWWDVHLDEARTLEYEAKSVRMGGDGSYSEDRASGGPGGTGIDFSAASLSPQAKGLLQPFRCRTAERVTEDVGPTVEPLSSREILIQDC